MQVFLLTLSLDQLTSSSAPIASPIREHSLQCGLYQNQCDNYFLLRFVRAQSPRPRLRKSHTTTDNTSTPSICSPRQPGEGTKKVLLVVELVLRDLLQTLSNVSPQILIMIIHVRPRLRPYTSFRIQILIRDNMLPILSKASACHKISSQSAQSHILTICTLTQMAVLTSALNFALPSTPPTMIILLPPYALPLSMSPPCTTVLPKAKGTPEAALPLTT